MKLSLRGALGGLWAVIVALCLSLGLLMHELFEQGVGAQLSQANQRLERASEGAARRFERYRATFKPGEFSPEDASTRTDLTLLMDAALGVYPGVEEESGRGRTGRWPTRFPPMREEAKRGICRQRSCLRSGSSFMRARSNERRWRGVSTGNARP